MSGFQDVKILHVSAAKSDTRGDNECCGLGEDGQSDTPALQPGTYANAELEIMTKTSSLKLHHDGHELTINDGAPRPLLSGMLSLVCDHGFTEKTARHLVKEAFKTRTLRCRVKYANPFLTESGPSAPGFPAPEMGGGNPMGFAGQTQQEQSVELPVPSMSAAQTDRNIYNPSPSATGEPMDDASKMQAAADTGQKEIFDTAMIGSMLKAVRDDTMIDKYLPELVSGMDRLGRLLFFFYWHGDKFADRYGKQDMPELEDSLRNSFEMLGDVILFLKQKAIEPYPEEDTSSLDIGANS